MRISYSIKGLPPCESCEVYQAYWTSTWPDYYTIAATATDEFSASIAASFKTDEEFSIKYVTELPTSVIRINDTYSVTVTCCEPWAYASVNFYYYSPSPRTRSDGRVFTIGDENCSPTSTYFVPDNTVVFTSVPKEKVTLAPNNTCETPTASADFEPETKTIVARLVPEISEAPEVVTQLPEDLPEDTPEPAPQSADVPEQGEPTGGSSADSGGGSEGGSEGGNSGGGSEGDETDNDTPGGGQAAPTDTAQEPTPPPAGGPATTDAVSGDNPTTTLPFESVGSKLQVVSCMLLSFLLTALML